MTQIFQQTLKYLPPGQEQCFASAEGDTVEQSLTFQCGAKWVPSTPDSILQTELITEKMSS